MIPVRPSTEINPRVVLRSIFDFFTVVCYKLSRVSGALTGGGSSIMPDIITSHEMIIAGVRTNFRNGHFVDVFIFLDDGYIFSPIIA